MNDNNDSVFIEGRTVDGTPTYFMRTSDTDGYFVFRIVRKGCSYGIAFTPSLPMLERGRFDTRLWTNFKPYRERFNELWKRFLILYNECTERGEGELPVTDEITRNYCKTATDIAELFVEIKDNAFSLN